LMCADRRAVFGVCRCWAGCSSRCVGSTSRSRCQDSCSVLECTSYGRWYCGMGVLVSPRVIWCAVLERGTHDFKTNNIFRRFGLLLHPGQPRPLHHAWMDTVVFRFHFTSICVSCKWGYTPCLSVRLRDFDVCG